MLGGMSVEMFYATIGAVLMGNGLTAIFAYILWRARNLKRQGLDASHLPLPIILLALIPCGALFLAGMLLS